MNLLLIIDFQKEYLNDVTSKSVEELSELVNSNKYDDIVFTRFINSKDNPVYNVAKWEGCMDEESISIPIDTMNYKVLDKGTYTACNDELINYIKEHNINNIYLAGFDIDCCVYATALNLFENNYNTYILKDYVYSCVSEELKKEILEILGRCIGEDHIV
ncbi:MAG: cysteine hydrolase [Bacilli bacterium]|nr:cysteine hydrolase [Bacilli bacterium]